MKEKPYIIRGDLWSETPAIVKISYGNKYVVAKCKTQAGSLKNIEDSLNAFIRGGKNNPNGIYFHLFNYVQKHPGNTFKVETLWESGNGYELLKAEQEELDKGLADKNLMNNQLQAYIPAYNEDTKMYGWLTRNEVLNFKKYMKARKRKKRVYM